MIYRHCEINNILAEQQKGCKRGSQGCKEQLLVDSIIMKQAYKTNRNIYTAYIDSRKAFDSVPHSWLLEVLNIYKINPALSQFLKYSMTQWRTSLTTKNNANGIPPISIPIKTGIFQADSFSHLWFCLALNPLSNILNNLNKGYIVHRNQNTSYRLSHLLYVDDIRIYGSTAKELKEALTMIEIFSNDVRMKFGIEKYKTQSIYRDCRV